MILQQLDTITIVFVWVWLLLAFFIVMVHAYFTRKTYDGFQYWTFDTAIEVKIYANSGHLSVDIKDRGIGIPEDEINLVKSCF